MAARYFSKKIVKWYQANLRQLPWRQTTDPYRIWLSEVILQQTRVAQGLPYYLRFVETFPTIRSLASAPEQKVLRLWQGLGYYSRARNLHKCAKIVSAEHDGKFPRSSKELQKLPGIGSYTAAAIASLAFGERIAVVDGNVFRVLSRVFAVDTPINSPAGQKTFTELANSLLADARPDLFNQAMMEFGATWCTPRNPKCDECPFKDECLALQAGIVDRLPVKTAAAPPRRRYFAYLVVERNNSLLMKQRTQKDIWRGLYDFALIEKSRPFKADKLATDEKYHHWFTEAQTVSISRPYRHILSHQEIHCTFIHIQAKRSFSVEDPDLTFYTTRQVAQLPKPALITRFLAEQFPAE